MDPPDLSAQMVAEHQAEIERLAHTLGGGWRFDQGIMPVVVLTLPEAQALEKRLT